MAIGSNRCNAMPGRKDAQRTSYVFFPSAAIAWLGILGVVLNRPTGYATRSCHLFASVAVRQPGRHDFIDVRLHAIPLLSPNLIGLLCPLARSTPMLLARADLLP